MKCVNTNNKFKRIIDWEGTATIYNNTILILDWIANCPISYLRLDSVENHVEFLIIYIRLLTYCYHRIMV